MGFGATLRALREAAGLSQGELAEQAGISIDSIQNWEQGRTRPRIELLARLASALHVSLDSLVLPGVGPDKIIRPRGRPRKKATSEPIDGKQKKPRGRPRKQK